MKRIFVLLSAATVILSMLSCNGNKDVENGQECQSAKVMNVDEMLAAAESHVGDTLTVEGLCTHVCSHSGRKMFLKGSDDSQMLRVESIELGEPFKQECIEHNVTVKGIVKEERINEEYLKQWEEELANMEQHGDGEAGCATEKKARNESDEANTTEKRIADFRAKIAERQANEGKAYLSFFHIEALEYNISE